MKITKCDKCKKEIDAKDNMIIYTARYAPLNSFCTFEDYDEGELCLECGEAMFGKPTKRVKNE